MSEQTISSPNAWTCGNCGASVAFGVRHACGYSSTSHFRQPMVPEMAVLRSERDAAIRERDGYLDSLDRTAKRAERYASALREIEATAPWAEMEQECTPGCWQHKAAHIARKALSTEE